MVSNLQEAVNTSSEQLWISEFGLLPSAYLENAKRYHGRLYKLTPELSRSLSDALGFTARFELSSIRTAYLDVKRTEGEVTFEIERNTKPSDIHVRYMRDRWNVLDVLGKGATDGLRPWIKSEYRAPFLPDRVLTAVAELVKVKAEDLGLFYLRVNFKDRIFGLICEDQFAEKLPPAAFSQFTLPVSAISTVAAHEETEDPSAPPSAESETPAPSAQTAAEPTPLAPPLHTPAPAPQAVTAQEPPAVQRRGPMDTQTKYATYSKSEIDQMMRQQADNIANALGTKISSQQRAMQEAMVAQEKAFNKLSENFLIQFEGARVKFETTAKSAQDTTSQELDLFKKELSKELDLYRTQLNKAMQPVQKLLDEKPHKLKQAPAKAVPQQQVSAVHAPDKSARMMQIATLVLLVVCSIMLAVKSIESAAMQTQLNEMSKKINQLVDTGVHP